MKQAGVERIVGVAAVGGITAAMAPGVLCVPDQVIDYTWGREHTLFSDDLDSVTHVDFSEPYCETLRQDLLRAAGRVGVTAHAGGTYGATQGPRLESAAEIRRMEADGCDVVGMTGMPETSLARELALCYASLALSVNWAAGKNDGPITMAEIQRHLDEGMSIALKVLAAVAGAAYQLLRRTGYLHRRQTVQPGSRRPRDGPDHADDLPQPRDDPSAGRRG